MTIKGLDYAWSKPSPTAIWNGGYRFVSRYLSWSSSGTKVIDKAELNALRAKGIMVALNWEHAAGDMKGGASEGRKEGAEAVRLAKALGYPKGCTVYFSCDWDATASQLSGVVTDYCREAAKLVRAAGYRFGIYGGYDAVKYAFDHKLVDDGWQTYAWSDGRWDSRAHLRQVKNGVRVGGADCDINEIHGTVYFMGGEEEDIVASLEDLKKAISESIPEIADATAIRTLLKDGIVVTPWPVRSETDTHWAAGTIIQNGTGHAMEANRKADVLLTKVDVLTTMLGEALKAGDGNIDMAPVLSKLDELVGQVSDLQAKLAAAEAERDKLRGDLAEALGGSKAA